MRKLVSGRSVPSRDTSTRAATAPGMTISHSPLAGALRAGPQMQLAHCPSRRYGCTQPWVHHWVHHVLHGVHGAARHGRTTAGQLPTCPPVRVCRVAQASVVARSWRAALSPSHSSQQA